MATIVQPHSLTHSLTHSELSPLPSIQARPLASALSVYVRLPRPHPCVQVELAALTVLRELLQFAVVRGGVEGGTVTEAEWDGMFDSVMHVCAHLHEVRLQSNQAHALALTLGLLFHADAQIYIYINAYIHSSYPRPLRPQTEIHSTSVTAIPLEDAILVSLHLSQNDALILHDQDQKVVSKLAKHLQVRGDGDRRVSPLHVDAVSLSLSLSL